MIGEPRLEFTPVVLVVALAVILLGLGAGIVIGNLLKAIGS